MQHQRQQLDVEQRISVLCLDKCLSKCADKFKSAIRVQCGENVRIYTSFQNECVEVPWHLCIASKSLNFPQRMCRAQQRTVNTRASFLIRHEVVDLEAHHSTHAYHARSRDNFASLRCFFFMGVLMRTITLVVCVLSQKSCLRRVRPSRRTKSIGDAVAAISRERMPSTPVTQKEKNHARQFHSSS
jgi:hypothetical protein